MDYIEREARVVLPKVLLERFETEEVAYIKLAWPGLWPVPIEMLLDRDIIEGLVKEFPGAVVNLNVRPEMM